VDEQVAAMQVEKVRALNERHDNIGAAIEQQAVRQFQALSASGDLTSGDLQAISRCTLNTQKLRRIALDADHQPSPTAPKSEPPTIVFNVRRPARREERVSAANPAPPESTGAT
jgi:hypothetical protein